MSIAMVLQKNELESQCNKGNPKGPLGFSLVELIVVVAIIGILASIVVPNYGKLAFKAQSAESKILMSSLYTAEKAFYSEYGAYHTSFSAVGFAPEGRVRFNLGFGAASAFDAGDANGFNRALSASEIANISTSLTCKDPFGAGGMPGTACQLILGPAGVVPAALYSGMTVTSDDFLIGASITLPEGYAFLDGLNKEGNLLDNYAIRSYLIRPEFWLKALAPAAQAFAGPGIDTNLNEFIFILNSKKTLQQQTCPKLNLPPVTYACASGICSAAQSSYGLTPDSSGSQNIICAAPGTF